MAHGFHYPYCHHDPLWPSKIEYISDDICHVTVKPVIRI